MAQNNQFMGKTMVKDVRGFDPHQNMGWYKVELIIINDGYIKFDKS